MVVDLPISELLESLPHRPPMVWIDRVVSVGKDYKGLSGVCEVDVDSKALYVSNGEHLRGSSAIEFTAQGFGYLKAAYQKIHKFTDTPSKTYLAGVRTCKTQFDQLDLSQVTKLQIRISVLKEILPITYIRGEVMLPDSDKVLAKAEIQVYFD